MSAITLDSTECDDDFKKIDITDKPFSLKVAEVAIPVLKTVGIILVGASITTIGLMAFSTISISSIMLISIASAVTSIAAFLIRKSLKSQADNLANPKWADYYSSAYKNRSLNQLMLALPNRNSWTKLHWSGEIWKEKILPYAITNRIDRLGLHQEFKHIFEQFDPLFNDYYREVETNLLFKKGFQELIRRSVDNMPATLTPNELREALIKETTPLSCKAILNQFGALPFDRNYLNPTDLISRFNQETENLSLLEIQNQYPADLLNRGILTTERFNILLNKTEATYVFNKIEKEFQPFTSRLDWFQSPTIQALFLQKLTSPQFSLSRSNIFRYSQDQFDRLPPSWASLLMEMRIELNKAYLGPSPEYLKAKRSYEAASSYIIIFPYNYGTGNGYYSNQMQSVINPMKSILLMDYKKWEKIDQLRQEGAYQTLNKLARQKISSLK